MDRETLKAQLAQTGISSNQLSAILDNVDKYDLYDEFADIGKRDLKSRVGYIYSKIRTKQQEQSRNKTSTPKLQPKNITATHINNTMLPHVRVAMDVSNKPLETGEGYEFPCAIKAFCIEYMLKCIEILVNADDVYTNGNKSIEKLIDKFLKESKQRLKGTASESRYSGHEINDILNTLMPEHIKVLIKFEAITNHVNTNIKDSGMRVEPIKEGESSEKFVINYFLMALDISDSEHKSLSDISSTHNTGYQKNNKAFMTLRYLSEKASKDDYELLNCLMVSTYMTLKLLVDATDLADHYESKGTIPYDAVKTLLTKNEYDELIATSASNSLNTNNLITYHAFLKYFLKDKTPKFNPERYARIDSILSDINTSTAKTPSKELLPNLYKKIDIKDLDNTGLKELSAFAPEFVFNTLKHNDKLIFKMCQERGITFELYYKLAPELFKQMATNYSDLFQGQPIDIRLLIKCPAETLDILETIKRHQPNCAIPQYYFDYNANEIEQTYQSCGIQTGLVDPDDLDITKTVLKVVTTFGIDPNETIAADPKQIEELVNMMAFFVRTMTSIKRNSIEKEKNFKVKASEGIKIGAITRENCETYGLSPTDFASISIMMRMANEFKTDTIKPLLNIIQNIQVVERNGLTYYRPRTYDIDTSKSVETELAHTINIKDVIEPKEAETKEQPTYVVKQINKAVNQLMISNPTEGMCFLREDEVLESYSYINDLIEEENAASLKEPQNIQPGTYLFYKKPGDVKKIVEMYRQYASCTDEEELIPFQVELLFFDMDILQNNFTDILERIEDKHCYGEKFTYANACALSKKRYSKTKVKKQPIIYYSEMPIELNTSSNDFSSSPSNYNPFAGTTIPNDLSNYNQNPVKRKVPLTDQQLQTMIDNICKQSPSYIPPTNNQRPRLH